MYTEFSFDLKKKIRRAVGCGIKDRPPIFGKIWKYLDWIEKIIQDAGPTTEKCEPLPNLMKLSLLEKIREKGPGILDEAFENLNNIGNVMKTVEISKIIEDKIVDSNDFDLEIEALFSKKSGE